MNKTRFIFPMTAIALAVLAGCSTVPERNAELEQARASYRMVQDDPRARDLAARELRQAEEALTAADVAWARKDSPAEVDHLAYLARQRVAIVEATAQRRVAEQAVSAAGAERAETRLDARTIEAEQAVRSAEAAQRDAQASQRDAQLSQAQAAGAQRQAEQSKRQAEIAQRGAEVAARDAAASQLQAGAADARAAEVQARLDALQARKTDRGMVVTIGDVLFDVNRAELKADGRRSIDKLVGFLKQYPDRRAMIEGFTDSTGSDALNAALSERRADAVRTAMVDQGIARDRLATQGHGDSHPIASNDTPAGRQSNRRVEVTLSDDSGVVAPR